MIAKFLTFAGVMALLGGVVSIGSLVIPVLFGTWNFMVEAPGEPSLIVYHWDKLYIKTTDDLFYSCDPSKHTCKPIEIQSLPGIAGMFTTPISVDLPCAHNRLPTSFPDGNIVARHFERRCAPSAGSVYSDIDIYVIGMEDGSIWSYGPSMFSTFDVLLFGFLGYIGGIGVAIASIPLFVIWAIFRLFRPRMKAKNDSKRA